MLLEITNFVPFLSRYITGHTKQLSEAELEAQMDRYFLANYDNMGKEKWFFSTTPVVYSLGLVWELSCNGLIQLYSRILEINHLLTQAILRWHKFQSLFYKPISDC